MKTIFIFILIDLLLSCKDLDSLNNKMYEVQKQAVLISPYKSASGTVAYVAAQKDFRLNTLPKLIKDKISASDALNDTIFITETYNETCINCSSDWMKVTLRDTIFSIKKEILGHKGGVVYNVVTEPFALNSKDFRYELRNSELIEVVSKIRKGESWMTSPLQYGSDNCNDGDHTIVTVVYPNKTI